MKLKLLTPAVLAIMIWPGEIALGNSSEPYNFGESQGSPVSTSSTDLVNQSQQNVTNNDTQQSSTGVVQQSAVYNVGQASSYDFRGISGTRIYCPKPALLVSGGSNFGGYGSSSSQVSGAFVLPLGGKLGKNCTRISNQIVKEQEQYLLYTSFQHQYEMASRCTALKKSGAAINPKVFPELAELCSGISIGYGGGDLEPDDDSQQPLPPPVVIPPPPPAVRSSN